MFGFPFQWPTLLTLAMFPVLVFMCVRLARSEGRAAKGAKRWSNSAETTNAICVRFPALCDGSAILPAARETRPRRGNAHQQAIEKAEDEGMVVRPR